MKLENKDIGFLGLMLLLLSFGFAFYTFGIFHASPAMSSLLILIYVTGMITIAGIDMLQTNVRKKEEKEKK